MVNDRPPKDRDIAMVFQNYALYPHMSVRDNMGFRAALRGMDKEEINDKVENAARVLDLEPHLDRKPSQLSGGQRQRVAMGRAIVRDPAAFLMDEPLEPRREAARADAHRGLAPPAAPRDHDDLCDLPRPDRGPHAGRPARP